MLNMWLNRRRVGHRIQTGAQLMLGPVAVALEFQLVWRPAREEVVHFRIVLNQSFNNQSINQQTMSDWQINIAGRCPEMRISLVDVSSHVSRHFAYRWLALHKLCKVRPKATKPAQFPQHSLYLVIVLTCMQNRLEWCHKFGTPLGNVATHHVAHFKKMIVLMNVRVSCLR